MEFNDGAPQYEFMAHHSDEAGVAIRKRLWRVFWIMLAVTILELIVGFNASKWGLTNALGGSTLILKFLFVGLTIVKAGYIVLSFMHLGDEKKILKYAIIAPYSLFVVYLVWIVATEGTYCLDYREQMDKNIIEQRDALSSGHGHDHEAAAGATEEHHHSEDSKEEAPKEESHH